MNEIYWKQSWDGDRAALLARAPDAATRELVEINFGPWDRLNEDTPFIDGIGPRPPGGPFYPADMTKEEFEAAALPDKTSNYTAAAPRRTASWSPCPTTRSTRPNSSAPPRCCARPRS